MAYKQEPCPLCGRNMTAIETYPGRGELYCGHCDLTIGGNDAKTPEELIALMDSSEHRQLKAENARLKQELEAVGTAAYLYGRTDIADENAKLRDENAEPRKLGGFMLRCISQYHDCADCLVNGEHCEISYIEADALELGIEVDG